MSEAIRTELAAAANTVAGVNVARYYRQSLKAGTGFVQYGGAAEDDSRLGYLATWRVMIATPQGMADAERWLDGHLPALILALEPYLNGLRATPVTLPLDDGSTVLAVVLEGVREQEN